MRDEEHTAEKLAELLSRLSPEKRALLALRLSRQRGESENRPVISRRGEMEAYPLSFAQQRLWFLEQLEPGTALYNIPLAVRLRGRLDVSALAAALNEIRRRHQVLRASFRAMDGEPVQVVEPAQALGLPVREAGEAGASEEGSVRRLAAEEAWRPFDLTRDPLLRASLMRFGAEDHLLVLTMHHIASDGWSIGVLMQEAAALYGAFSTGRPSPLEELPIQYTDFAVWQREWLKGEVLEAELAYWREQLAGAPPVLELPTDRARPPIQSYHGATRTIVLPLALLEKLEALGRQEGVTLFMLLLAAFKVLLYRYTGQADIVLGTPIAGRTQREVTRLIGLFINTLVLRTQVRGDDTFRQLLKRVSEVALSAFAHQSLPFEKLVDELQPARSVNQTPLFQVMFVLQNTPRDPMPLEALTLTQVSLPPPTAKFDLTLAMETVEEGMTTSLSYNTDLFDATTIARMLGHLQVLLESVVADAEQRLADLPLLTKAEWNQLVEQLNRTASVIPLDLCVHELIEAQAARTPEAIAVVYEGARLSYEELNRRANQLGHHLQSMGVGPEVKVGICLESSLETIVGLLGILKAGGAYVGLDPLLPRQRLAFMLEDTRMPVLVTQQRLLENLPEHRAQVVCLDADWPSVARQSERNVRSGVTAANLSHVIYTSGSTGNPKAVMGEHSQVLHYLYAVLERLELAEGASYAMHQNLAVDAPVTFMFGALMKGGALHIISQERAPDPEALGDYFRQHEIDYFKTAPSHMAALQTSAHPERVMPRRLLLLGGEASHTQLIESLKPLAPDCVIVNHYGPTETTVGVITYRAAKEKESHQCAALPLGRPLANSLVYLLDKNLNPVPAGVPAELHIGGRNLARGYLNRPELTAEKFIPDPFSGRAGARLYRTGDLARHLSDGHIEFLGRLDHQVKIRGFRVELEEVEAILEEHPAVRAGVVITTDGAAQDKHLVAYILAALPGSPPAASELRNYLREKLPDYMIPTHFMLVEEWPRTPQGKVDRRALSVRRYAALETAESPLAPLSTEEELLLALCSNLLGQPRLSIADNFFNVGGHSLLATQLVARIRHLFGVELSLRSLFEAPTLSEIARAVGRLIAERRARRLPPLRRRSRSATEAGGLRPYRLSYAQQRIWFIEQLTPHSSAYNVSSVIRLTGRLDQSALRRSLQEIVRRHDSLRTSFHLRSGEPLQLIAAQAQIELAIVDLTPLPPEQQQSEWQRMAEAEATLPFDLERAPLLRASLLQLGPDEHLLFVTMHHIISDGWSLTVLARELGAIYEAYSEGRESPLEELAVQYPDYAEWQREWLKADLLEEQLSYWRSQLSALEPLHLPTDHPRPALPTYEGASYEIELSPKLMESLREQSLREGVTLYMQLLASFSVLMWRMSGGGEVVVGTVVAGRQELGLEELIGFFVNTLVMRVRVEGEESYEELVRRVREVALEGYMHQDVPFERVVEEVGVERDLSRNPLFQVLFVLQNVPRQVIRLPDLSLAGVELESKATRFDLELHVWERAEGLKLVWIYSTQLFEVESIRRMADRFQLLLEEIGLNPARPVSELQFLPEMERRQMLFDWNRTRRRFQPLECLHHGFETQAELTPDSIALQDGDRSVSYRELNERADQLAAYLCSLGVEPEALVGILMQRNIEMVLAILGVLKAGAAYVPMDPSYPRARQRMMMEDAGFKVVLTEREFKSQVAEGSTTLLCLDEQWDEVARCERMRRRGGASGENLAYVIYTSGSTGRPKGVAIEHRSATNFVRWSVEKFGAKDLSVVLFATSICFDLSVFELFAPLSCGGQVVIAENALQLSSLAAANRVRLINSVPSAVSALVQLKAIPEGVRVVNLAGEALRRSLVEELYRSSSVEEVYNLYGPTEYTTYTTCAAVGRGASGEPNIGRPVANTEVYVLDSRQQLAGVCVVGEIYIGGAGLARGYMHRPEQTAQRFIPHPFGQEEGARLYRTGDLGWWLANGELEYLGRVDEQVKIRGYRIELGEVEAVLQEHEYVKECVAAMREEAGGDKRLLAYVVPQLSPCEAESLHEDAPRPQTPLAEERAQVEQVAKWELVWDETYRQPPPVLDPRFNIVGWVSSYTGLPIPPEQMREWLDQTVGRILALRPARLLEIGAGTGLLLFRLADACQQYYATDFSAAALRYLQEQLEQLKLRQVTLLHRRAEDFTELDGDAFDTVVLNSVVQYFPGVDYLLRVLERAVKAVRAGGAVFVGDVRSLPLLEAFHASVQLRQAASSLSRAQLRQLVRKRLNEEQELIVAPAFFYALQQHLPEIARVQIKVKRGRFHNELTRFRYDVILHVGERERRAAAEVNAAVAVLEWEPEHLTVQELRRLLVESEPDSLRLKGVPNARLEEENRTLEWLADEQGAETAGQWRAALREFESMGVEPEDIWALGDELPYEVEITYGPEASGDGRFDVLLRRRGEGAAAETSLSETRAERAQPLALRPEERPTPSLWAQYANNPLRASLQRNLAKELRRFMAEKLPDYMIPAAFILLDALPLTPNGKVDRRALPAPGQARPELEQGFVGPRTEMEEKLAAIWSQVLGLERVGVFDNFFELGGDSILSIQVIARAHEQGMRLTPRQLFQNQTVAGLAAVAGAARRVEAEQDAVTGLFPLTPWQRRFFRQGEPDWQDCAQLFLLEAREPLDSALLEQAVVYLFMQHDALRLRFVKGESGWQQMNLGVEGRAPLVRLDLPGGGEDEERAAIEAAALELQAGLAAGSLAQVALVETGAGKPVRLLLATSSLILDERSMEILLEDLERACGQLRRGEAVTLGAKTNSFKQWVGLLMDYRHATKLRQESSYWMRVSMDSVAALPAELFIKEHGAVSDGRSVNHSGTSGISSIDKQSAGAPGQLSLSLDAAQTRALLEEVPRAYRTELREVLLTALAEVLIKRAGGATVLVDLESEARTGPFEGCDLSRTAGQFKTIFPVMLELEDEATPGRALQAVKEKLRAVPAGGLGYGLLRYATDEQEMREQLASLPQARIIFRMERPLRARSAGASLFDATRKRAPAPSVLPGRYLLEVGAGLDEERLTITWRYDEQQVRAEAVASVAAEMMAALQRLIAHCLSPGAGGYSLSDFKEFKWDAGHLAEITSLIEKSKGTARAALQQGRIEDLYPLSSAQEGMLFHTLREAGSNLYLHQFNALLEGRLDIACFARAWQKVVDRHSILRTSFLWEGLKEPVQVVERGVSLQMRVEDWRQWSAVEREARLAAFMEADRQRSFSLTEAPLMRLALLRMDEQSYRFIWTHHHLLLDGWSLNLVLAEVLHCYEAYRRGDEPALALPQPYRSYIAWLRRQEASKSETFWREKLGGFNRPTTLGRPVAASDGQQAERLHADEHFRLSKQATAALRAVAQQHQLTLSTVAQGIWALLLSRYSGEDDVVFGSVVSGRPARLAGVESMVGLFINTLPVRARIDGEAWLLTWLRQLQEQEAEMREHQHSPLVEVHGYSDVPRTEPLFESIVSVDNYPVDILGEEVNDELRVREVRARQRSNYPLAVVVVPGIELSVRISYDCRRFRSEMIDHLLGNYARLLNKVVSHPHATLNALQMIKEEEKKLVRKVTRIASLDESFNF